MTCQDPRWLDLSWPGQAERRVANKLGVFFVKHPPSDFAKAFRGVAARVARLGGYTARFGRRDFGEWAGFAVRDPDYSDVSLWSQGLSLELKGLCASVLVYDGSWTFDLFNRGEAIVRVDGHAGIAPQIRGSISEGAAQLGITEDIFRAYCVSPWAGLSDEDAEDDELLEELEERFDEFRAGPGDEFPPWDEWGFTCLLQRFGCDYPDPDECDAVDVTLPEPQPGPRWELLPPTLDGTPSSFAATRPK